MKNKLLKTIYMLSKYALYGFVLQLLFLNFGLPIQAKGQYKSIGEVSISLSKGRLTLGQFFKEVQAQTSFTFSYDSKQVDRLTALTFKGRKGTVEDFLKEASEQSDFTFRQYNNSIDVIKDERGLTVAVKVADEDITVTGTVTDSQGEPLPGVTVSVSGTVIGTATDIEGRYSLSVPEGSTLVYSFIGFESQHIEVGDRNVIDVVLTEGVAALDEVVVVGYGTQERREITSAVSSISEEEFNRGNVNNLYALMQGKVAGLSISKAGSDPNQAAAVRLRGITTLGGNSEPLVVVDGVIGVDLNTVDPNDIQTIDVLKDASAAAIYGSRGASGVIIVTTKSGVAGEPRIEYNSYVSAEEVAATIPVMNAEEYIRYGIGPDFGADTDWFDEITRTAISQSHNLALTGGSERTVYRASVNFRDIEGVARRSGFDRFNARFNLTQRAFEDRLALTLNFASTISTTEEGGSEPFRYATTYNPTSPVRSDDPEYEQYGGYFQQTAFDYFNPVARLEQTGSERQTNLVNINLQAEYEPIDGVQLLARFSRQRHMTERAEYTSRYSLGTGMNRNGYATRSEGKNNNQLFEATGTYNRRFGDLEMTGLVGYSYQEFTNSGFYVSAGNFLTDFFQYNNLGAALDFGNGLAGGSSYKDAHKIIGFFGRLTLNYNDIYFLSATLRREGSTMFGEGNKWGNFPAVSAGIDISEFMDVPDIVNNLKFRASYGVAGNTPGSPYLSLQRLGPLGYFYYGGNWLPAYGPSSNPNPNLRWEKKKELDIGLDFVLLRNRLTGSFDYYNRTTTDLIYPLSVPVPPNLVDETELNIGEISSNGLEAALSYRLIDNDNFSWNASINGSYFINNTLVSLSDQESGLEFGGRRITSYVGSPGMAGVPATVVIEGEELGIIWGPRYQGLTEDGRWVFEDLNDDGQNTIEDETVIGNAFPDFQLGFGNSFSYNSFDLNLFFRGTFGHDILNSNRAFYENTSGGSYNVVKTKYFNEHLNDDPQMSDFYVEKGDYLLLDNATLGYNFSLKESSALTQLRFYLSGQNLFIITNYTGADPEVRQDDPLAAGVDLRSTWMRSRTYTFGVQVSF